MNLGHITVGLLLALTGITLGALAGLYLFAWTV